MLIMYVVKAFDRTTLTWVVVGLFETWDAANLHQDSMWFNDAAILTEVEYRGF